MAKSGPPSAARQEDTVPAVPRVSGSRGQCRPHADPPLPETYVDLSVWTAQAEPVSKFPPACSLLREGCKDPWKPRPRCRPEHRAALGKAPGPWAMRNAQDRPARCTPAAHGACPSLLPPVWPGPELPVCIPSGMEPFKPSGKSNHGEAALLSGVNNQGSLSHGQGS
ncbi:uncharacterized protein LOC144577705 [Callithrix jacchus]